ncbi:MAG TPA: M1 family metallopeptidase, partial [Flavisolibacter sp.]|nr:M1 family metallopeptidase [Flavisolibacter sp.]
LDFKVDGITSKTEDHPRYIDIVKLILPVPLLPGRQVQITTPFHVKLPYNFSRGGYDGQSFQLTQWYPKPAVYDHSGWHPMPYLDQGEFYSEFGSYNVRINIPEDYVVAATGTLKDIEEVNWLKTRTEKIKEKNNLPARVVIAHPNRTHAPRTKIYTPPPVIETIKKLKTINFSQDNIHDFAWFANKDFIVDADTCMLSTGKVINVSSYYTNAEMPIWKNSLQMAKDALRFYTDQVGEYPYPGASIVQGPKSSGGGMEYPTITIIAPLSSERELDETIAHELGHNWFYGALATNERDHPWMDEGINTFYEYKYIDAKYGIQTQEKELLFETKAWLKTDQPIETPSQKFSITNYDLVAYHKTAEWMRSIEDLIGKDAFKEMMHAYFLQWSFKHPQPEDFKSFVQTKVGKNTDSLFQLLNTKGILPGHQLTGFKLINAFKPNSITSYLEHPTKNALLFTPAIGFNAYDKLMAGIFISNYKLPPSKLRFFAIPLYATGSKSFAGIAKLNYTIPLNNQGIKTEFFLNGSAFSMDKFTDSSGHNLYMHFQKLVPGFRITFKKSDYRSTTNKYIQWKTFLINEQSLAFKADTIFNGIDTSLRTIYSTPKQKRYLNQLQFVLENYRALYPYKLNFQVEQAQDFIRPTFTMNYYFNYSNTDGLHLRFFAGKFIYLNGKTLQKQFANDRYLLNMTGAKGYEDYTYSEYFVGRNNFEGFASQQIMIRDGGFKVRTDLLADKIGKTDDWLTALNLNASLPQNINPLSILPVKVPLHIFLDIGTYAETWRPNFSGDRILYDIGFHLPLFAETVNIYIPIFYNKVYSDYFKSTLGKNRFLKTISFNINLYNKALKQINHEIEF